MDKLSIYYMEKDGAVKIPEKYKKMSYDEITDECSRLTKDMKNKAKTAIKKTKMVTKTKFVI